MEVRCWEVTRVQYVYMLCIAYILLTNALHAYIVYMFAVLVIVYIFGIYLCALRRDRILSHMNSTMVCSRTSNGDILLPGDLVNIPLDIDVKQKVLSVY